MYVLVDFSVSSLDIYRCACVCEASSASKIQEVSEAVCQDAGGQAPSSTQHLRQIGASGKHPGNCERDLHRYCRARHLACGIEPYEVQTVLNNEYGEIVEGCLPVLLPHEIMWALWQQDEAEFFSRVSGKCDAETFWANSVACGHVEGHPHKDQIECDPSACIPLRVHGDEAPISRAEGLMVLQCTSVLSRLSSMLSKFLMLAVPMSLIVPQRTLEPLYAAIVWSFQILATGIMPSRGHDGRVFDTKKKATAYRARAAGGRVMGKFLGIFMQLLGDLKWLKEEFRLPFHYNHVKCCCKCKGVKRGADGPKAFDYGPDAEWQQHPRTHAEVFGHGDQSELVGLPGFAMLRMMADLMHIGLLGVVQWAVGAILWECVRDLDLWPIDVLPGGWKINMNRKLALAYTDFKEWSRLRGVSTSQPKFSVAKLDMSTLGGSPYFKGKANNTLYVAYWLSSVATAESNRQDENVHLSRCSAMLWGYCSIFTICREGDLWLTDEEVVKLEFSRQAALYNNAALSLDKPHRFPQKPKHHELDHAIRESCRSHLNPGHHWAFSDEDFIGRMAKLGRSVHRTTLMYRMLQRYLIRLQQDFSSNAGQREVQSGTERN